MPTLEDFINDRKSYPDDMTIKLADGFEVPLKDLRSGFMKDADYRRKTSDLARDKENWTREQVAKEQALVDAEKKLETLAERVVTANPKASTDEVEDILEQNPVAKRLRGEITELRTVLKPLAEAVMDMDRRQKEQTMGFIAEQHRRVLHALKQQDPDLDEEQLLGYARDGFTPRLDIAYKAMNYEKSIEKARKEAKEVGIKEGYEKGKQEAIAPVIPLRRSVTPAEGAPQTMEEAVNKALQDPDVVNPLLGLTRP